MTQKRNILAIVAIIVFSFAFWFHFFAWPVIAPHVYLALGEMHMEEGEYQEALGKFEMIEEEYPEFFEQETLVSYLMAAILSRQGDMYAASYRLYPTVDDVDFFVMLDPRIQLAIGEHFLETDNVYYAKMALERVDRSRLPAEDVHVYDSYLALQYLVEQEYALAQEQAETVIIEAPEGSIASVRAHAVRFFWLLQEDASVVEVQDELSQVLPKLAMLESPTLFLSFIRFFSNIGVDDTEIIEDIDLDTQQLSDQMIALVYTALANSNRATGEIEFALSYLDDARELHPEHLPIYLTYAKIYWQQNDFETAYTYYQKAAEIDPFYFRAQNGLGWSTYELVSQGKLDETQYDVALDHLQRAIDFNPEYARPYNTMGTIFAKRKEFEDAIVYFKKAIEYEEYEKPYRNLGLVYRELGDEETAEIYFRQAFALSKYAQ